MEAEEKGSWSLWIWIIVGFILVFGVFLLTELIYEL